MRTRKISLLVTLVMVIAMMMLVGCKSFVTSSEVATQPEVKLEATEKVVNSVETEEPPKVEETRVSEAAVAEEPIVEETVVEEPVEELYIPEGIDMESTLPGEEWVASFVGNVAEPVVVIYNDNSGRKEVVQANSEVTINPDEDIIAIYFQDKSMGETTHAISVKETKGTECYHLLVMDSAKMRTIPKRPVKVIVMGGAEDWVLEFTIMVE